MPLLNVVYEPPRAADACEIESLLDQVFGLARRTKTSYRLREGEPPLDELALVAREDGRLIGTISYSPVVIGCGVSALLLGPIAVALHRQGLGVGVTLMETTLKKAAELGHGLVILIGDESYYRRVGFRQVPEGRLLLPGPYDPARLLYRELAPGALQHVRGLVLPPHRWRDRQDSC